MSKLTVRTLGERLLSQRSGRGVREVAREIGISPATLSRIERGNLPDLESFGKICKWLAVDPAEVLGVPLPDAARRSAESQRLQASAHFRADRTTSPELATALADMILATQDLLRDTSR